MILIPIGINSFGKVELLSKLLDSLFLLQRADKQLSILLGYDIAIQALNYYLAFIGCMNHAIFLHSYKRMSLPTLALPASSCGSKVRRRPQLPKSLPAEFGWQRINFLRLLHHSIVNAKQEQRIININPR